jgi:YggT family protein
MTNPFLLTSGRFIIYATNIYIWIILIRVFLTWINPNPYSPVMRFLARAADPVLNQARRILPFTLGGLDFSPVLAIIAIQLLGTVLGQWLLTLGQGAPGLIIIPLAVLGLLDLTQSLLWLLILIMAARLLMSWVRPSPYNMIVQVIYGLTEPLLAPLRRAFPPGPGGLDWRPLIFLVTTLLVQKVVLVSLAQTVFSWLEGLTRNGF